MSDTDTLGAFGIADRRLSSGEDYYKKFPLAVPLQRLFVGNGEVSGEIIGILSGMIRGKSVQLRVSLSAGQTREMARIILGWFRSPRCRACGGHGFKIIRNTTTIGDTRCKPCDATGTIQLERLFPEKQREIVIWAIARMELEAGMAGPEAMKALAPKLDL
jgi:hypothetical protein